jgi:hypothetical protein
LSSLFQRVCVPGEEVPCAHHSRIIIWMILKWIFKKWDGECMDWIVLAEYRDRCQALVNVVKNLQVPQNAGNFMTS